MPYLVLCASNCSTDTKNYSCIPSYKFKLIAFILYIEGIVSRGSFCIYVLCLTVGMGTGLSITSGVLVLLDGW